MLKDYCILLVCNVLIARNVVVLILLSFSLFAANGDLMCVHLGQGLM